MGIENMIKKAWMISIEYLILDSKENVRNFKPK